MPLASRREAAAQVEASLSSHLPLSPRDTISFNISRRFAHYGGSLWRRSNLCEIWAACRDLRELHRLYLINAHGRLLLLSQKYDYRYLI